MKKVPSSLTAHATLGTFLIIIGIGLLAGSTLIGGDRTRKASTAPAASVPIPFSGTYTPGVFPCTTPKNGPFIVGSGQVRIIVQVSATLATNDLTVTLLFGAGPNPVVVAGPEDTGVSSELLLYQPAGGVPAGTYQVQICESPNPAGPPMAPFTYNGTFTTDDTGPAGGLPLPKITTVPPAAQDNGPKVGFENFIAPGQLIPVTTTSAGLQVASVEYMGRNAGEPSIGNNWLTDTTIFYSDLESLFVKFNDTCPANGLSSTWVNRPAPTAQAIDSDPIGFTDSPLGHSLSGQLTLLSPTCKTSFTDNDGATWVPTQGSGFLSGVDHETIGGGRFAPPLDLNPPSPLYSHAVYYCSQEGSPASGPPSFCSLSEDGGLTFGGSVPLTNPPINVCGGLHGHVKVSPKDGAAYVPFNTCDGVGSVVVSLDNGTTWTVRHVQTATNSMSPSASFQDPAVAVDANGRVYYIIANNDTAAAVLTSDDHGQTWQNLADVAAVYGLKNIRYPAATAGDTNRAAVAFLGTKTPGDALQPDFAGVWHLYVASTFDGGATWSTTDVTPNAPMQRGCIWAKGGANICRNMLDFFDMTVDKDGRVEVGYVNGCEGGNCVQAPITAQGETPPGQGNAYTTAATIARQSSGRRLSGANQPTTSKPGMPFLTQKRVANFINLQWSEADTGNLMINNYQVLRGTASGAENPIPIATVSGTQIGGTYTDVLAANDTTTYFYKVLAVNSAGTSCGNNEVAAPYLGTGCTGIIIHRNDPAHMEANGGTAAIPQSLLIDYVAVGEPPSSSNFVFKMKVNSLATVPPNSRWRIAWDSYAAQQVGGADAAQQFYVGMTTGPSGPPTFEYGTLADAGVPAVFVISETTQGTALNTPPFQSNFAADGTITIYVPKSAFGNPQPGALLGAVNGRTITGDAPGSPESKLERSNAFTDHTFVKAQTDSSFPASTYTVLGNNACNGGGIAPVGAVSRKTHGGAGDFDVDLPLTGNPGIECRTGGASNTHTVVVTFAVPVTVSSANCDGGAPVTPGVNGSVVTVTCSGLANAQTHTINLVSVSDGVNSANVAIPMGVLLGDVNANRLVNSTDTSIVQAQSGKQVTGSNFRTDVNTNGLINSTDTSIVQSKSGTGLP